MKELVTKIGGRMPQRKPEKHMNIPELVKKVEKKMGIKQKTVKEQLKELAK